MADLYNLGINPYSSRTITVSFSGPALIVATTNAITCKVLAFR